MKSSGCRSCDEVLFKVEDIGQAKSVLFNCGYSTISTEEEFYELVRRNEENLSCEARFNLP